MSLVNVGVGFAGGAWAAPTILAAATPASRRAGITSLGTEAIGFSFFINNSDIELEYILHLERHGDWIFQQPPDLRQEPGAFDTVNRPVIGGQRAAHHMPGPQLTVRHDGPGFDRTDAEDAALRRIDDRRHARHAEHAQIRYRERTSGVLAGLELTSSRAVRELLQFPRYRRKPLAVRVSHDGRDKTARR